MRRSGIVVSTLTTLLVAGATPADAAEAVCTAPAFSIPRLATAGFMPSRVVTADFDSDGHTDVAAAGYDGATVLLGDGSGELAQAAYFPRENTMDAAVGDFDGDGRLDLAVSSRGSVEVRLGDGAGGFGDALLAFGGIEPHRILAADFNLDGLTDLAAADSARSQVVVLYAGGGGRFGIPMPYSLPLPPAALAAGDYNLDGYLDLFVATVDVFTGGGEVVLLMAIASNGQFRQTPWMRQGAAWLDMVIERKPGLLIFGALEKRGESSYLIVHHEWLPFGDLWSRSEVPIPGDATAVHAADFNNDGLLDFVVRSLAFPPPALTTVVHVILQKASGGFAPAASINLPTIDTGGLALADLDGDELADIVMPGVTAGGTVSTLLNRCGDVGGQSLRLNADGGTANLSWDPGTTQAGYFVGRLAGKVATILPPGGVPLPAAAATFEDPSPIGGRANCYVVAPVDTAGTPLGRSDMLCLVPDTASGDQRPFGFELRHLFNGVGLRWARMPGADAYVVWRQFVDTWETSTFVLNGTSEGHTVAGGERPSCFVLLAYNGTALLGHTDMLCAVSGIASAAAR